MKLHSRDQITEKDRIFIEQSIKLSSESVKQGGFPVGAIVVKKGFVLGCGLSNGKNNKDATSHAEIEAIRSASKKLGSRDLFDCEIYSSMEPCLMCFSACYWAGIKKIFYAVGKDKLSKQHYEGIYSLGKINSKNNRKIKIIQIKELQDDALAVIGNWEKSLKRYGNEREKETGK